MTKNEIAQITTRTREGAADLIHELAPEIADRNHASLRPSLRDDALYVRDSWTGQIELVEYDRFRGGYLVGAAIANLLERI